MPEHAPAVADRRGPQSDRLDRAAGLAEVDHVADAVLILEQHEQPGDQVLDQCLGAEAEGQTGDAGAGEQRRELDAELARTMSNAIEKIAAVAKLDSTEPIASARCRRRSRNTVSCRRSSAAAASRRARPRYVGPAG